MQNARKRLSKVHLEPQAVRDDHFEHSPYPEAEEGADQVDHMVYNSVRRCDQLFRTLRTTLSKYSNTIQHQLLLRDEHQRFEVWIGFIGALARQDVSLDYRLRYHPEIQELVLQVLGLLENSISHDFLLYPYNWSSRDEEVNREYTSGSSALTHILAVDAALQAASEAIDRLQRLATMIRRSSTSGLVSRVKAFALKTDPLENAEFAKMSLLFVSGLYPNMNSSLAQQLATSIQYRRLRLMYVRRHQKKLKAHRSIPRIQQSEPEQHFPSPKTTASDQSSSTRADPVPAVASRNPPTTQDLSVTDPSVLDKSKFFQHNFHRDSDFSETATVTSVGKSFPYPSPPKVEEGEHVFTCDWCYEPFKVSELEQPWWWKSHFQKDLEPYVCISEECCEPLVYFKSSRTWRKHMEDVHTLEWTRNIHQRKVWYCDFEPNEYQEFRNSDALKKHILSVHPNALKEEQLARRLSGDVLPVSREPDFCPICEQNILLIGSQDREPGVSDKDTKDGVIAKKERNRRARFEDVSEAGSSDDEPSDPASPVAAASISESYNSKELANRHRISKHIAGHLKSLASISIRYIDNNSASGDSGASRDAALGILDDESNQERLNDDFSEAESTLVFEDIPQDQRQTNDEEDSSREGVRRSSPRPRSVETHVSLADRLPGLFAVSTFDAQPRHYLPEPHTRSLITQSAIEGELKKESTHFVGRSEELDAIHRELEHDGSRKTVVVHGLGGMGKTQLALAYAQRHKDEYSAVFWVNTKDVDTLKQGYAAAARRIYRDYPSLVHLKAVIEGSDLDEVVEAVKRWLSSAGNDGWLVIYDNYDTPKLPGHDEAGTFDIRPFLPEADQGAIIITTRSSQLQLGRPVAVKKLRDIEDSLEILTQTSKRDGLIVDPDAQKLADELDGLPLDEAQTPLETPSEYMLSPMPATSPMEFPLFSPSPRRVGPPRTKSWRSEIGEDGSLKRASRRSSVRSGRSLSSMSPAASFLARYKASEAPIKAPEPDDEGQGIGYDSEYIIGKQIGYGGFSIVKEVTSMENGKPVIDAVKIVRKLQQDKSGIENEQIQTQFDHEVEIWRFLRHPYILPLLRVYTTDYATFCITRLNKGGTLFDLIRDTRRQKKNGLPAHLVKRYAYQLASAMRYLHNDVQVVHRDINLENCLLDMTVPDAERDGGDLLLCDFGMADFIVSDQRDGPEPHSIGDNQNIDPADASTSIAGSLQYAAPELFNAPGPVFLPAADIWAFGVVMFALLTATLPFNDGLDVKTMKKIQNCEWDADLIRNAEAAQGGDIDDALVLVRGCLEIDVEKRWNVYNILECALLSDCEQRFEHVARPWVGEL